jgi:hypothetical protein
MDSWDWKWIMGCYDVADTMKIEGYLVLLSSGGNRYHTCSQRDVDYHVFFYRFWSSDGGGWY